MKSKTICMIVYSFYEGDKRVRRYAESLVRKGYEVDVLSLKREGDQENQVVVSGVNVYKIQTRIRNEKGTGSYAYRLLKFTLKSLVYLSRRHFTRRYALVHVHNVPDFLVFAALLPKLTGAKIILDIHDIVPELYISKFGGTEKSIGFKWLAFLEKISIAFSDHVIISNHLWQEVLISRSARADKVTALINYPDLHALSKCTKQTTEGKFVMLYPGTLNWHQGVDVAIKAFGRIKSDAPNAVFYIYGEGPEKESLKIMSSGLGLGDRVIFKDYVSLDNIAAVMANADLGIVPKRANTFGNEAFSTKIPEFMALRVPVIVSDTKIDKYYFDESMVRYFKSDDDRDLSGEMLSLIQDKESRDGLVRNAYQYIKDNNWDIKQDIYLSLVSSLLK